MFQRKRKNNPDYDFANKIEHMISTQLIPRGITSETVLNAFRTVRRDLFLDDQEKECAYKDYPLSIGYGQTISQPFMVALMTQCLEVTKDDKVLEVGTGSGYQTAILAELAKEVYTVERLKDLAESSETLLKSLGYNNVKMYTGDGTLGWKEYAPYNKIIVTAGATKIPDALTKQLSDNGVMVIPVGGQYSQELIVATKNQGKLQTQSVCGCVFVPLIGKDSWENY